MYELGKTHNWNAETDIDWDLPEPELTKDALEFIDNQWKDHEGYAKLSELEKVQFVKDSK